MNKGQFKINGTTFNPKSFLPTYESLQGSSSGRTLDGVMHIDWVRRNVHKIEIEMPPMTTEEVSTLLSLVQGQEYSLTYYDPLANQEKTINVYTSTSSANCYSGILYNGLWQGVKFNAIEL